MVFGLVASFAVSADETAADESKYSLAGPALAEFDATYEFCSDIFVVDQQELLAARNAFALSVKNAKGAEKLKQYQADLQRSKARFQKDLTYDQIAKCRGAAFLVDMASYPARIITALKTKDGVEVLK